MTNHKFRDWLGKAKVTTPLRAGSWLLKLDNKTRLRGAQGRVRAFLLEFHYNSTKAANRAVGAAQGAIRERGTYSKLEVLVSCT